MTSNTESCSREEILIDHIISRLPVKSLLRFKCVCKNWCDLFNSLSFIRKHCDNRGNGTHPAVCKFGVNYNHDPEPLRSFNFYVLPEKIFTGIVPTHQRLYRCEGVTDFRCIYGPVNGLFVLEKGHYLENVRFCWWNPATRECRLIPKMNFELLDFFDDHTRTAGIGLDLVNNDYKFIWIRVFYDNDKSEVYPKTYVAVYSLNDDSWKFLDEPDLPYDCNLCVSLNCTYLDGLHYWMSVTTDSDGNTTYGIRTFDFATELFGKREPPPFPSDHWGTLMLRCGSIAAISCNDTARAYISFYDIWVTIGEDKWIKVFTINPQIPSHWPQGVWDYDKFIFELTETRSLVFYDHSTKEVTNLGFNHFRLLSSSFCWFLYYKESIVPVKRKEPTPFDNAEYFLTKYR
ncbi:F-box protein At1g11270-like [Solanum stenotomum]|uniref:F-box protein At1g11270-like n=1 Tax=Solanum stenotomum TaxID=172797 RepID=UPI0020D0CE8E|nr:F-box protein At1g11270-like [Solanum stenotomum]